MNINMTWKFLEPLISFITTHTLLDPLLKRGHPPSTQWLLWGSGGSHYGSLINHTYSL